jgi:pimeloyl-ACP methyl ester carboxylesterase
VRAAAALWPLAVINLSSFLNSAWDVACIRARRAGKLLATMLVGRVHGDRPVVLVGLSIGALLAFECLLELHRLGARALPSSSVPFLFRVPKTALKSTMFL